MVQFEMAAIYSAGLDKADGNEVLPRRGGVRKGSVGSWHRPPGEAREDSASGERGWGPNPCSATSWLQGRGQGLPCGLMLMFTVMLLLCLALCMYRQQPFAQDHTASWWQRLNPACLRPAKPQLTSRSLHLLIGDMGTLNWGPGSQELGKMRCSPLWEWCRAGFF